MLKIRDERGFSSRPREDKSREIAPAQVGEGHDFRPILVFILIVAVINIFFAFHLLAESPGVSGGVSVVGDATHFEFNGVKAWQYKVQRLDARTLEIELPKISDNLRGTLVGASGPHLEKVEVEDGPSDGRSRVRLRTRDPKVQSFDYLTDDPVQLIVDLFFDETAKPKAAAPPPAPKPPPLAPSTGGSSPAVEYKEAVKTKAKTSAGETVALESYKQTERSQREPASELPIKTGADPLIPSKNAPPEKYEPTQVGLFDAGDPEFKRFQVRDYEIREEAIIASRENIYIRFPMLKVPVSKLAEILAQTPEYEILDRDSKETKEAKLLTVLFKNKRWASYLKVAKYFLERYPESEYREMVEYMMADVHYTLYLRDNERTDLNRSLNLYARLLTKYPQSPLAPRTRKLLNYMALERGNGPEIVQQFQEYLKNDADPSDIDQAKMALAEGHLILKQWDTALGIYDEIEKSGRSELKKVEANYRRGDVHLERRDYQAAFNAYLDSEKKYPQFVKVLPNLSYNLAETLFWLGDYGKSLDRFREYLTNFPKHDYNAFALTRVGELLEILGAEPARVLGAFMESTFRFQNSPGAEVARVRTLSRQMADMKDKELAKAQSELLRIGRESKLARMEEFVTLMISDGYHRRGEFEKSLDYIVGFYQKNPMTSSLPLFRKRIVNNISNLILQHLDDDKFMAALDVFNKYQNTWLRSVDRIDIPFLVGSAFEKAGVFDEADRIFQNVEGRLTKINGTREWLERKVHEHLPSMERIHLRRANVALNRREYSSAFNHLADIKNLQNLTDAEKVERIELGARIYEEKGQPRKAAEYLKELVDKWQGSPDLLSGAYLKRAEIELRLNGWSDAEQSASRAVELFEVRMAAASKDAGKSLEDRLVQALNFQARALEAQKKEVAAIEVYTRMIERFPQRPDLAQVRYRIGEILFARGDLKGAREVWAPLKTATNPFYSRLADQKLQQQEWEADYRKYIDRIPAMSEMR